MSKKGRISSYPLGTSRVRAGTQYAHGGETRDKKEKEPIVSAQERKEKKRS